MHFCVLWLVRNLDVMPSKTNGSHAPHHAARVSDTKSQRRSSVSSLVITIDGPAGVGKSTVAKLLAKQLGVAYLDTGATYRVIAYAAIQMKLHPVEDVNRLASLAEKVPFELKIDSSGILHVMYEGKDIGKAIRTEEISEAAAQISQHAIVRKALVRRQRKLADRHGVVAEGRDTGSVVFPQAAHKFFLVADVQIRTKRRQKELSELYGSQPPFKVVKEQLYFRDSIDLKREAGALVKPKEALAIDTSHMSARDVVQRMLQYMKKHEL